GFTDRQLRPDEEQQLLDLGLGITNLVARVTASAAEVSLAELREGALRLERVVATARPGVVAVLGMGAYRRAWSRPTAELGLQPERLGGAEIFLLPNPSGLQARYQLAEMVALFSKLREVSGYSAR
ncbi:MAG TPA: mismatch-specific DNA-glycosylase, partial [Acidimicrobiales bacterium]|nr:mismatch-specific DNA-glycosylase [Acidimicrobiales bacterium]